MGIFRWSTWEPQGDVHTLVQLRHHGGPILSRGGKHGVLHLKTDDPFYYRISVRVNALLLCQSTCGTCHPEGSVWLTAGFVVAEAGHVSALYGMASTGSHA